MKNIETLFKELDYEIVSNKPLIYRKDDGGYITEIAFLNSHELVEIKQYEIYAENEPVEICRLSLDLLKIMMLQAEQLNWEKYIEYEEK